MEYRNGRRGAPNGLLSSSSSSDRADAPFHGFGLLNVKRRSHGRRSWIRIDRGGNSEIVSLDNATLMKRCCLPSRDLRLLDPLFVYPSTILGREKAIVVSLEQIRCIITADEVMLMKSPDSSVLQYESELCERLRLDPGEDLPFEFQAFEVALELTCTVLDAQASELENEITPVLDELASSISVTNLERARRFKSHLLALTHRVQKAYQPQYFYCSLFMLCFKLKEMGKILQVHDEIEQLMDDDGDMAEMYLSEKKERIEESLSAEQYVRSCISPRNWVSKSLPASPLGSTSSFQQFEKAPSSIFALASNRQSLVSSSNHERGIEQLEMLLEAYFAAIDSTLSKLSSLKEYIDDTEDFINIKLDNIQNQLIRFEMLLTGATFVVAIFTVVTGVFGMNFIDSVFNRASNFNGVLIASGLSCVILYSLFLLYAKHKKVLQ